MAYQKPAVKEIGTFEALTRLEKADGDHDGVFYLGQPIGSL